MQYCPKCEIRIRGRKKCCPLCQGRLTGEPEEPAFPMPKRGVLTESLLMKIATFVFAATEIGMAATGYLAAAAAKHALPWVPLVMIGAVVAWLDLILAMRLRNNLMKIITVEAYVAMIIDYVIDRLTGFMGWSVIWMIPATFLGLAIVTVAIGKAAKLRLEDYIIYLLNDTILCMLQIIPILLGQNDFEWPAVICMALYLILISAALIFRSKELKNAAAKYFNV